MRYRNVSIRCRYVYTTLPLKTTSRTIWIETKSSRMRRAKQIAKTSDLIHKKYRALKTSKIEEDIALQRHFKYIVETSETDCRKYL